MQIKYWNYKRTDIFFHFRTFIFFVLLLYNSLLKITIVHITFIFGELFMEIDFANILFVFIKDSRKN